MNQVQFSHVNILLTETSEGDNLIITNVPLHDFLSLLANRDLHGYYIKHSEENYFLRADISKHITIETISTHQNQLDDLLTAFNLIDKTSDYILVPSDKTVIITTKGSVDHRKKQ